MLKKKHFKVLIVSVYSEYTTKGVHAKGLGDGDPAVRVCNVDPRHGTLH